MKINLEIIDISPKNLTALNRLGIAYLKISHPQLARKAFNSVLKINPKNNIALKNISNIKHQSKTTKKEISSRPKTTTVSFIEEPGISKIIPLMKPGSPQTITNLTIGEHLTLKPSARRIKVFSKETKEYIGRVPDDLSLVLSKLIKSGYKYETMIKSTNPQSPQIFVQEIKRSKRLSGVPSFPVKDKKKTARLSHKQAVSHPLQIFDPLTKED